MAESATSTSSCLDAAELAAPPPLVDYLQHSLFTLFNQSFR